MSIAVGASALLGTVAGSGVYFCLAKRSGAARRSGTSTKATTKTVPGETAASKAVPTEGAPKTVKVRVQKGGAVEVAEVTFSKDADAEACKALRALLGSAPEMAMELRRGTELLAAAYSDVRAGETLDLAVGPKPWADASNELRNQGNTHFKSGGQSGKVSDFLEAMCCYRRAYCVVPADGGSEAARLVGLAKNNCAQVCLKCGKLTACRKVCAEILTIEPNNAKALYRKSVAARRLDPKNVTMMEEAVRDLELSAQTAPTGSALEADIKKELEEAKKCVAATVRAPVKAGQDLD